MASPYPIQIDYLPNEIVILHEVAHNVRYIHMDQKAAPANTPLTYMGYSVGRWQGNTLVIDTDHFNDKTQVDEESLSHGLKLQVHEEITKFTNKYGGVELRNLITISDPDHYTHPWTAERLYPWRGDVKVTEYTCEGKQPQQVGQRRDGGEMSKHILKTTPLKTAMAATAAVLAIAATSALAAGKSPARPPPAARPSPTPPRACRTSPASGSTPRRKRR